MCINTLDTIYSKIILKKYFTHGWGNPENLVKLVTFRKLICKRETCILLLPKNNSINIMNEEKWSDCKVIEGKFKSPLSMYLPDIVPRELHVAYFQMILPLNWKSKKFKPVCIHLAGTGDHFYWKRRYFMAKPLLKADIGAIILENPYYGLRKPKDQNESCLKYVSDIIVMGGCLILECLTLLKWCEKMGFGPLGISGLSMGGHMASLAATNWPKPIILVPCLSWSTGSLAFTEGVISNTIDWNMLQNQYHSDSIYYDRISNLISTVDKESIIFPPNKVKYNLDVNKTKVELLKKLFTTKKKYTTTSNVNFMGDDLLKPRDAVHFMRGIMDECTHLKNFSVPFDTSLIIAVCAQSDGYIPRKGCSSLEDIWPGTTVRYLNGGHVSSYVLYRNVFRNCIIEAFEKAKKKLYS